MLQIELVPITEIKPYENNAKIHTREQIEQIKQSIFEFGNNDPIAIDANGVIIEGHGRLMALQELGYTEVEVIRLGHLNEEQRKAYTLIHNKLTMNTGFDLDILATELQAIENINMKDYDFDLDIADDLVIEDIEEDNFNPEVPDEPKVKRGQVYQLGEHRLMCGDSTSPADIELLMNGVRADMVFTDPPYGMKKEADGVANDNLNYDDLLEFNKKWAPLTFDALKDNGSWYCWGIDVPLMDIYSEILKPLQKRNEITLRNYITWDKGHGLGQLSNTHRQYATATEKAWFVMKGVQGFNTNQDNYFEGWEPLRKYLADSKAKMGWNDKDIQRITGVTTVARHSFGKSQWEFPTEQHYRALQAESAGKAFEREYEEIKREYYATRAYFDNTHDNMNDVWHFSRTSMEERELTGGHATPKPIALCARAIKSSSREGEIVLDVFGGSGSTLIACEQLNRSAYIMELEPKWCDVIIKRWETFTGKKAELLTE